MEGPSLIILKEECARFEGKRILNAAGNTKVIDPVELRGKTVLRFDSWGKHFLIVFKKFYLRVHFLMFGSYRINEEKDNPPRLHLTFRNGTFSLYSCSVKLISGSPDETYERGTDLMSDHWDPALVLKKLNQKQDELLADLLLDQNIFTGSGNIIKNEVLYRMKYCPDKKLQELSLHDKKELIRSVRAYCLDFYRWKKKYELRKHWMVYKQRKCKHCGAVVFSLVHGRLHRRTYFCSIEQQRSDN